MTNLQMKSIVETTRKRGLMSRILRHASASLLATLALLAVGRVAQAQETTGRVVGRVVDQGSGAALQGVTVIVQGPQGEDNALTDEQGQYLFTSLPVGMYTIRFYMANSPTPTEQPGVVVAAERTVRVNAKIASTAQAAAQQTYVITGKAPSIDVGSARVGATFGEDFNLKLPNGRTYGDVIQKAPGVFVDPSGNVSIGGATGLENIYIVNGMNVTGMEFGNLDSGAASMGGGTNLPLEFLTQIDVSSGGYTAEFGGGMGGVVNTVLKSGSNEFHGSVFGYSQPYWLSADPNIVTKVGGAVASKHAPDFGLDLGAEVGGPIVKDKLFFWAGFAPSLADSHVYRLVYAEQDDGMGGATLDKSGNPVVNELKSSRRRINETRRTWNYGATLDFAPAQEHHLNLALLGTPNFTNGVRSVSGFDSANASPSWAAEKLTKTNTDVSAHWTSKFFDRKWQLDALVGYHREDFNDRSPDASLNNINQLEYHGANLWDLEHIPGCEPTAMGLSPCPTDNYHSGGFGLAKKYTGQRTSFELKSTHQIEAGGHHEFKYGWHGELGYFDQDRYYSGPPGGRSLVQLYPGAGGDIFNTYSFFTLQPGESPTDYSGGLHPATNLLYPPQYQDHLKANVSSVSHAFFVQDSYSPAPLRNLTLNAGVRLELQKMNDSHGSAFLDTTNIGPRFGAIYDPFSDGRTKISASYGRYFEAIPMNIAARYFGGEGILQRNGVPLSDCGTKNAYDWTGAGEWKNCNVPALDATKDNASQGSVVFNNGSNYAVQPNLKGQFHNEVVGTVERELMEDLTARIDYVHRWLGSIIEDGSGDSSLYAVLANPGDVPQSVVDDANTKATSLREASNAAQAAATAMPMNADLAAKAVAANSAAGNAEATAGTLKALQTVPKPQRTYDAISLSLSKRFSKNWQTRASYTYSRLVGNYEGLYQYAQNYFAPNGANAYDATDLNINSNGRLPNDRPHLVRVDGSYGVDVGKGHFTVGLSVFAQSGMPRNYMSALVPNQQLVFLLPRGSGGRTPWMTQFDGRLAYGHPLTANTSIEAFIDLFNLFNEKAAIQEDDNYTVAWAGPIENGTAKDLKYAKDISGASLESQKNPNYGHALVYQVPFHGRMGVRLTF
ncbi:MAG: TonB-dependent receptor plug [Myxococcales bacterium]|nr:TonB-dependent receptor plug [Myxococcales bacterium]